MNKKIPAEGDWVVRDDFQRLGRVKHIWADGSEGLLDIVLPHRDGTRWGRESPAMGGPKGFEPACPMERWTVIQKPNWDNLPRYGSLEGRV